MTDKPIPTKDEELHMYRGFLHDLNTFASIVMDHHAVHDLIGNACDWSYAHRVGNGEPTEEEQEQIVANNFWDLREVRPREERHDLMMKENMDGLRQSEIEHVSTDLVNSIMEKYKVESVDNLTCPIMKRLCIAIRGSDDEVRKQVNDRLFKKKAPDENN